MDKDDDPGWCTDTNAVENMHFDATNRFLYVVSYCSGGNGGVFRINVDTWEVDSCWDCDSTPAVDPCFCDSIGCAESERQHAKSEGKYAIVHNGAFDFVDIINGTTNNISHYNFSNISYGACVKDKNVNHSFGAAATFNLQYIHIEESEVECIFS